MATTEDKTYNGWKNHQTWNVSLWLNNEYSLYTRFQDILKDGSLSEKLQAEYVENLCKSVWRQDDGTSPQTPDKVTLKDVDWLEIVRDNKE